MLFALFIVAVLALVFYYRRRVRKLVAQRGIREHQDKLIAEINKLLPDQIEELESAIKECALAIKLGPYRVLVNSGAALEIGNPIENPLVVAEIESVKILAQTRPNPEQKRFLHKVAVAVQSWSRHCEFSYTDQLTGVRNRKGTVNALRVEIKRAKRTEEAMCVLAVDIDNFSMFNNLHGHDEGDRVIRQVAQTISKRLRETDVIGRHGNGDEFIIALPSTGLDAATEFAEILRLEVTKVGVELSIGATSYKFGQTREELIKAADDALYRAKAAGKNRVSK